MEGQHMIKQIKVIAEEEAKNSIQRKLDQKKMFDQIYTANQSAITVKNKRYANFNIYFLKLITFNMFIIRFNTF